MNDLRTIKDKVIELAAQAAGSKAEVARQLGVRPQNFVQWRRVPPAHVIKLEALSGVSRCDMRPDVFCELSQ